MAALAKDRNTPRREGDQVNDPVAAGARIHAGSFVVLSATGYAAPGSTALNLSARGLAEEPVDNTGGADGDLTVAVRRGIFRFANEAGDLVARTHIGGTAYVVDDQTVAATDGVGTRSAAGKIVDVDADGVWVEVG